MQLLSSLFTATMTCFLPSTFLSHCFITSHNMFTSLFSIALSGICTHHLSSLSRLYFPHNFQFTILVTLSCFLLYTYCSKFSHWLTIESLCFSFHTSALWWINSFINLVFDLVGSDDLFLSCTQQSFSFNFQNGILMAFRIQCFRFMFCLISFQTIHTFKPSIHSFVLQRFFSFHSSKLSWIPYSSYYYHVPEF